MHLIYNKDYDLVTSKKKTMNMSAVARAIRRIQPHIPLIKFRFVKGQLGSVDRMISKPQSNSTLSPSVQRSTSIDFTQLPSKYRRLEITQAEMDYINRGGPQ